VSFQKLVESLSGLQVEENRVQSANYRELVFFVRDTKLWTERISVFLGAPVKEPGTKPAAEHGSLTKAHGGIAANQTLFHARVEGVAIIAMYWPWQDGERTTLKLAIV